MSTTMRPGERYVGIANLGTTGMWVPRDSANNALDERDQARAELERLRDRLSTMNECVRIYVGMRDAGTPARPGWLEEEVAATDQALALKNMEADR